MFKLTLRSLWDHKRRLVSTVLAIVLGVAFMSGTLVFADTIDKVFDDLFSDVNEQIDVQVQGESLFDGGFGGGSARADLDVALLDTVGSVEGVERVAPFVQTVGFGATNRVFGPDGEVLGSSNGPPTLLESWVDDDVLNPYTIADGAPPQADDEVALNVAAAEDADLEIGDEVRAVTQGGESTYTLVGTFTFGEAESAAGAVSVDFTLAEAQRIAGLDGQVQTIFAAGDGSIDQMALAARVGDALPDGVEAITGEEAAEQTAGEVTEGFDFFRILLIVFAVIAVIVGTFIIFNTFSILVAQRTRELALLRAIGASRGQVLGSVMLEATVIGLLSALLGLLAGVGLAQGVTGLLSAAGADFPTTSLVIGSTTITVAFAVGLGITLVAAILPAVQATRVPPLAALREVAVDRAGASRPRLLLGALVVLIAAFGLSAGARGVDDALPQVGFGAFLLIIGAIIVGPALAEPTVRVLGAWLPQVQGVTGRLAKENAARSPKRTSATASALLIGVALIGFITIFASSAEASIESEVNRGFQADLIVQGSGGFGPPPGFPFDVADEVEALDEVESVNRIAFTQGQVTYDDDEDTTDFIFALEPENALDAFTPRMADGEITDLGPGGIVVDVGIAEDHALAIGDAVTVTGPGGAMEELTVDAIGDDFTVLGNFVVDIDTYGELVAERQLVQVAVTLAEGASLEAGKAAIEPIIEGLPGLDVLDQEEFIGDLAAQITSFLTLLYALLALSVIIAAIGIANTLSLSITERTRELGLLRAVGMTRAQLRTAVCWEAIIISVLGTLVGLGLGLLVSFALVNALDDFGLSEFALPIVPLGFIAVAAAVLGLLASLRPAFRAAKLDVLDAIATE